MWYEVAAVKWTGEDRVLALEWMDPARRPVRVATVSTDPRVFMRTISERVDHSIVVHKSATLSNGTRVSAWIRRREDDASSPCSRPTARSMRPPRGRAARFEAEVRDSVGLD